jgi:hypothetical protein
MTRMEANRKARTRMTARMMRMVSGGIVFSSI